MFSPTKIDFFNFFKTGITLGFLLVMAMATQAQIRLPRSLPNFDSRQGPQSQTNKKDTIGFEHRNDLADSITISYRHLSSLTNEQLDTTLYDFGRYYSVPTGYATLGNNGNAAFPILYSPKAKTGFDPGFHAFDVYDYTIENTRFFQTTRPYTSLSYFLGAAKEQVIKVLHTQNINPGWNAAIEYRLIAAPGIFQNQNTSHNNYRFASKYQGKRKRYTAHLVILGNSLKSAENGGITDPKLLDDPNRKRRVAIPVNLGNNSQSTFEVFSTKMAVGNEYSNMDILFRQSYDLGKQDSLIINDSTTEYLFYPKLRFQHTIQYKKSSYQFIDHLNNFNTAQLDSSFYASHYDIHIKPNGDNYFLKDAWQFVSNDFVLRQFPQTKNMNQFIEAGIRLENFSGTFSRASIPNFILEVFPAPPTTKAFYNVALHGEYRNKTKNKKWDAILRGEFYPTGWNATDYNGFASVSRVLNKKWGDISISFQNLSRKPSYIFDAGSAFNLDSSSLNKKENITVLQFDAKNPRFTLMARNVSIANYAYFTDFYHSDQYPGIINLTQVELSTKNKVIGHLNLYSNFIIQQTAGNSPIKVPLFYTRQRLAFEGRFFKNLNLSTGLDVAYQTPYKANNYSPLMGRFFPQDSIQINNRPQINVFFNFRIKTFTMFFKVANLNTLANNEGLGFTHNNFVAPLYPTPGFIFSYGVKWGFIN